ncbi:hypothetical protein D6D03_10032 [Aureobasidium pullulans]|nr:hypothetical protein D6D03_10032 [Aureobasidium pullulans]
MSRESNITPDSFEQLSYIKKQRLFLELFSPTNSHRSATGHPIPADTSAEPAGAASRAATNSPRSATAPTIPAALPNQLLPPRHQPIYLIDKHEDPQTQRLALPNQPLNISLLRSDPVPLASRTAVVAEGSIMIPPAFVKDFPLRLRNAGISEGMVYNAAPLNEFSPDSYPRGPIPFPRIEGLPDPLRPTYAQNEHTETTPSDYWHNQVQSPRLDSMTNDEGLTAVRNIVLHVAANMYSKRGKGDAHDPGPQSPPNVYGSKTESYVIRRSPESVTKSAKRKKQHRNTPVT